MSVDQALAGSAALCGGSIVRPVSGRDEAWEGHAQAALADATGRPRRHISEMDNGKRPIAKKNARLVAEALIIDPKRLLAV